jgi:hypothetical protein
VEQGLGTTFQQMLQLKTNVDHLSYADAEKFRQLSSQLYGDTSGDRLQVAIERDALIANIRRQPGNESFLRPQPYKHLRQASKTVPLSFSTRISATLMHLSFCTRNLVLCTYHYLMSQLKSFGTRSRCLKMCSRVVMLGAENQSPLGSLDPRSHSP